MIASRISELPWTQIRADLWASGHGRLGKILEQDRCQQLRVLYANSQLFRSRIDMARFRFGQGEYQYFAYPLAPLVAELRGSLYRCLAGTANDWMDALCL